MLDLVPAEHAGWLSPLLPSGPARPPRLMELALAIAEANIGRGGGPFGAVVAGEDGQIVSLGWNDVVPGCDSTAHAEILAIRRAQRAVGSHDLASVGPLTLYASCEPCIQCFGAIWWSGLRTVRAAATRADAEALGFHEGPVTEELWAEARRVKGIDWRPGFGELPRAVALLRSFSRNGRIY